MRRLLHQEQELFRNHRSVEIAIRVGFNYRTEFPARNFVVFVGQDGAPILQQTQLHYRPAFGYTRPPTSDPRPRRSNVETNSLFSDQIITPYTIQKDISQQKIPTFEITTIQEFFKLQMDPRTKIILFPFAYESVGFVQMKTNIQSVFYIFSNTLKGYYPHNNYLEKINKMDQIFLDYYEKIQTTNNDLSVIETKKNSIFHVNIFIKKSMNVTLDWYYKPYLKMNELIELLKSEMKHF